MAKEMTKNLKKTLQSTLKIAIGLQGVTKQIYPDSNISLQAQKRVLSIQKDIHQIQNRNKKVIPFKQTRMTPPPTQKHFSFPRKLQKVPSYLKRSVDFVNKQVILSRAGKITISKLASKQSQTPPLLASPQTYLKKIASNPKRAKTPLPYVSLQNGSTEQPITLPSFTEYLKSKGSNYLIDNTEQLFTRIQNASKRLTQLRQDLDQQKLTECKTPIIKRRNAFFYNRNAARAIFRRYVEDMKQPLNLEQIKSVITNYYTPTKKELSPNVKKLISISPGFRFQRIRDRHKKKLNNIIEKLDQIRPFKIKNKLRLFNQTYEQTNPIQKFRELNVKVEECQREKQYSNYRQGLGYLNLLEELKSVKYVPNKEELDLLETWREILQGGWVIYNTEYEKIIKTLSQAQIKKTENILERLKLTVINE